MIKLNKVLNLIFYRNKNRAKLFYTIFFLVMMFTGLMLIVKKITIELDYVFYGEKIRISPDKQANERVFSFFHEGKWHKINNPNDIPNDYVYYSPHFNKYFLNEPSTTLFIFRVIGIMFFLLTSLRVIKTLNNGKNLDSLFLFQRNENIHQK